MKSDSSHKVSDFYASLSEHYDAMTGATDRIVREEATFRRLLERYRISSAVDAGCGTGLHSCVLARLGVDVVGVDVSKEMLSHAVARADALGLKVQFIESTFSQIKTKVPDEVDAVFCLGNSLPHLLTRAELLGALRAFHGVLKPKGTLFLQLLNYDRILSGKMRVQSVKEAGQHLFIRFYDFMPRLLRFNILTLERNSGGIRHQLASVDLRPISRAELSDSLTRTGFRNVRMFGSTNLDKFRADTSVDLVVVAGK